MRRINRKPLSKRIGKIIALSLLASLVVIFAGCNGKSNTTNEISTVSDEDNASTITVTVTDRHSSSGENKMMITSKAFADNGRIPVKYANKGIRGGQNISIPLEWTDSTDRTKSFAISMIDVSAHNWVHWMVVNIPSSVNDLPEGASVKAMPSGAKELDNTFGYKGYGGPQPPAGSGDHVYVTTIYALSVDNIDMSEQPSCEEFKRILNGNIIEQATIKGIFAQSLDR